MIEALVVVLVFPPVTSALASVRAVVMDSKVENTFTTATSCITLYHC